MQKKRQRALTILETMVVISLIALVMGVLGYNMKGVLDKGKAFRTEQTIERLYNVFQMAAAEGATYAEVKENLSHYVRVHGMVKKPDDLLKDGWGIELLIELPYEGRDVRITSAKLQSYQHAQALPARAAPQT